MKPKLVPSGKFYLFHVFYMAVRCNFKATVPTSKAYFDVLGLKLAGRKSHLKKLEYPHVFFSFAFAFYSFSSVPLYHFGLAFIYGLTLYCQTALCFHFLNLPLFIC